VKYTVVLDADDEGAGYTATVPALPGCLSEGATREEAIENIREAILGFIESLEKAGEPIPTEKKPVELITVAV
jgi:antitoxin HicB